MTHDTYSSIRESDGDGSGSYSNMQQSGAGGGATSQGRSTVLQQSSVARCQPSATSQQLAAQATGGAAGGANAGAGGARQQGGPAAVAAGTPVTATLAALGMVYSPRHLQGTAHSACMLCVHVADVD